MKIRYTYNQHRHSDHSDVPHRGTRTITAASIEAADDEMYRWREAIHDGEKRPLSYPWVGIIHFPGDVL